MTNSKKSGIKYIYFTSIVLLMLNSMKASWLWALPDNLILLLSFFTTILCSAGNFFRFEKSLMGILWAYVAISIVGIIFSPTMSHMLLKIPKAFVIIGVILLKESYKRELFHWFITFFSIILVVTIPAWLLFLFGYPFHHGPVVDIGDGFHYMYDYGFFVKSYASEMALYQRFCSVFLEPGWIGTMCLFSLVGLWFKIKSIPSWLSSVGIVLSVSLSAIVNLFLCLFLSVSLKSKHKVILLSVFFSLLLGVVFYSENFADDDNVVSELVISRLVYDEELGIAGNNRTNETFDAKFKKMMSSSDVFFGIGQQVDKRFVESNDWFNKTSGIKKELMINGVLGTGLFLLFLYLLFKRYRCKQCFIFGVCFLMAAFIRNLWRVDYYVIIYIITLSQLYFQNTDKLSFQRTAQEMKLL